MENPTTEIFTFWSKDWTKKLIVRWNYANVKLRDFERDVIKSLGTEYGYERRISSPNAPLHVATKKGLKLA